MAVHFCLAYFLISEAEWWRQGRKSSKNNLFGVLTGSWTHFVFYSVIAAALSPLLASVLETVWTGDMLI